MIRMCAWCQQEMGNKPGPSHEITHGICPGCLDRLLHARTNVPLQNLLDRLGVPVFLLDNEARVLAANTMAAAVLGKDVRALEGGYSGDAVECARATIGGGCGTTPQCRGCSLLGTVEDTYATGRSHHRVSTTIVRATKTGRRVQYEISTERLDQGVLLRIDAIDGRPTVEPLAAGPDPLTP